MKNEAKAWTSNLGTLYSPSKLQQILCENQSGFSAVQASPDFSKPSVSVLISQSISAEAEKRTKDCAKPSADWLRANLHLSNAEIAALYDYSKPLDVVWLCRPHHLAADRVRRHAA